VTQLWRNFGDLVPVASKAAVVLCLVAALISWGYRGLARDGDTLARVARDASLAVWAVGIAALTLVPSSTAMVAVRTEFVPFSQIWTELTTAVSVEAAIAQLGGNLVLWVPGGILLAIGRTRRPVLWTTTVLGAAAVAVELLQLTVVWGRVASTDDVLLALAGAALGAWTTVGLRALRRVMRRPAATSSLATTGPV
jgi:glycopeptide antibiotics resistance protein